MVFDEYSAQPGIYLRDLGELRIPVPPLATQRQIVDAISLSLERIRSVATAIRRQESLILEYRSALITAAVTGQIDVRSHAS